MNVYDVETIYNAGQIHSVVARNMAEAERLFLLEYSTTTIISIKLHSRYVQVQGIDEKPQYKKHRVSDLALGTRFRYSGSPEIHVLLSGVECGTCIRWTGINGGNPVCSVANSREEFMFLEVEVVDNRGDE